MKATTFATDLVQASPIQLWLYLGVLSAVGLLLALVIHGRRQAVKALSESERRWREILEVLPVGVFVFAKSGEILAANRMVDRIWGADATGVPHSSGMEEFRDYKGWWLDTGAPLAPEDWAGSRSLLKGEVVPADLVTIQRFDGAKAVMLISSVPLYDEPGGISGAVAVIQDVTERHAQEQRLRDSARDLAAASQRAEEARCEAEAASRAKSQFLANVSHEIRTPMNGILGMAELLLRDTLTPGQRDRMEMIRTSAEALLALVNDILDLSKVESGRLELRCEDFRLRELVGEALQVFAHRAAEAEVDLRCLIDPDLPDELHGDPIRLRQVLLNLVGNAVRFTRQGAITVKVEREALGLRFEVEDTGTGIRPEVQTRLFEPYVQSGKPVTRELSGTGLGLVISKSIVELMGGEIGFTSERGTGSRFWFRIPLMAAAGPVGDGPPSSEAGDEGRHPERSRFRILIADDHPINRAVALALLQDLGYTGEAVESGPAALAMLEERPFDALLLDCEMVGLDGYDTCRALRRREAGSRRLPVIALTAYAMPGDREKCLAAGMDDYIPKPFRGVDLATVLDDWLGVGPPSASPPAGQDDIAARLATLRRLEEASGKKIVEDVKTSFVARCTQSLAAIRSALASSDGARAAAAAHSLVGSSGLLGATGLARLARDVEILAGQESLDACAARLPELEQEIQTVVRQLESG
ncbi:MAG TPA: ATP-binding protein [Thermoanaerobaculia bacterium]|jgi:signal transduction histidine kinase/DNA-binding NarL/FixJ family response regulator|nr:ATP-binding protein [Thermoanaerobaculia bacterium]